MRLLPADFDRFDICYAHQALENDYNVGGWLHERPSNQRRKASTGIQLHRMGFVPAGGTGGTFSALEPNQRAIYVNALRRWRLPPDSEIVAWAATIEVRADDGSSTTDPMIAKKRPPTPAEIKAARLRAGHTQTEAAHTVFAALKSWQQWEAADGKNSRTMNPSVFRDYLRETGQPIPSGEGWEEPQSQD